MSGRGSWLQGRAARGRAQGSGASPGQVRGTVHRMASPAPAGDCPGGTWSQGYPSSQIAREARPLGWGLKPPDERRCPRFLEGAHAHAPCAKPRGRKVKAQSPGRYVDMGGAFPDPPKVAYQVIPRTSSRVPHLASPGLGLLPDAPSGSVGSAGAHRRRAVAWGPREEPCSLARPCPRPLPRHGWQQNKG